MYSSSILLSSSSGNSARRSHPISRVLSPCLQRAKELSQAQASLPRAKERIKRHVFVCILAPLLKRLMERKTDKKFRKIMQELEKLKANVIEFRSKKFLLEKPDKQIIRKNTKVHRGIKTAENPKRGGKK